ncbi:hypothetical protein F2Q69_00031031 [Brassica cretica]|uniref:Uncharacterized protein n=1 Tax=Brassica cretica TaxID=69181 RepID=A0A8S9RZT1_BRACR|nr:hypothetical protein F2Q69_00031031 [Brassica cretica]
MPIPGDLRDVLKRKLKSKDDNSSENTDLRLTLNARKSQRTSTGGADPKGHPRRLSGDLRDKLNASVCDLRVLLNSSKPTDIRRRQYADTHIPLLSYVLIRHLAEGPNGRQSPIPQMH